VRVVTQPGLHSKIPLIDSVISIDKRILDLENPAQEVIASDQKRLVVDAFCALQHQGTAEVLSDRGHRRRREFAAFDPAQLGTATRAREATLTQVVRDQRDQLMARVREQLNNEAQAYGIDVVDVRIRRADLPEQNSQAVYQRMQTSVSRKPPSSAPRVPSAPRRSARARIAT